MLIPAEFARMAVTHGTVATVSDPHEIANVCGIEGVHYMIANGKTVPFKFYFGAPSCVPATIFETAGAAIDCIRSGRASPFERNKISERDDEFSRRTLQRRRSNEKNICCALARQNPLMDMLRG